MLDATARFVLPHGRPGHWQFWLAFVNGVAALAFLTYAVKPVSADPTGVLAAFERHRLVASHSFEGAVPKGSVSLRTKTMLPSNIVTAT